MNKKSYTLIELNQLGSQVEVRCYSNDNTLEKRGLQDGRMEDVCDELSQQGWSVTINGDTAICRSGRITRIDFYRKGTGLLIKKYPEGWTASTNPVSEEVKDITLEFALKWCVDNGWTVREWNGIGARAFQGSPKPVRTKSEIIHMRRTFQFQLPDYLKRAGVQLCNLDLAYDL